MKIFDFQTQQQWKCGGGGGSGVSHLHFLTLLEMNF